MTHAFAPFSTVASEDATIWRTGGQIVQACGLPISVSDWMRNLEASAKHVDEWCNTNSARISLALMQVRSNKVIVFIVPKSEQYDFELGGLQADLDVMLNTSGAIGYAETRQIPAWEIERFLGSNAVQIYPLE